jgi:sirohydrochlorin cobaltochelatase
MSTCEGLLLFAHGARDPSWARPFEAVAASLREARPDRPLALAFLELMTPDLATAGGQLVADGCEAVTVVPLFLGAGGHVKRDLPRLLDELQARHPATRFRLAPAIGETASVIAAIATAAGNAAEAGWPRDDPR